MRKRTELEMQNEEYLSNKGINHGKTKRATLKKRNVFFVPKNEM